MTEYNGIIKATYWDMMGVTEFEHDPKRVAVKKDSAGLYEELKCKRCGDDWIWHIKYGTLNLMSEDCHIPDPIPLSPAELAEYMQRRCVETVGGYVWSYHINVLCWWDITPEQKIDAAVKAWKVTS